MGLKSLICGCAAIVLSGLNLALHWFGRFSRPGENNFDLFANGVMFGSLGLSVTTLTVSVVGVALGAMTLAFERPLRPAALVLGGVVACIAVAGGLTVMAWNIGSR